MNSHSSMWLEYSAITRPKFHQFQNAKPPFQCSGRLPDSSGSSQLDGACGRNVSRAKLFRSLKHQATSRLNILKWDNPPSSQFEHLRGCREVLPRPLPRFQPAGHMSSQVSSDRVAGPGCIQDSTVFPLQMHLHFLSLQSAWRISTTLPVITALTHSRVLSRLTIEIASRYVQHIPISPINIRT